MTPKQSNSSIYHGLDIALGHARRMNTIRESRVDGMIVNVDGRMPAPRKTVEFVAAPDSAWDDPDLEDHRAELKKAREQFDAWPRGLNH